MAFLTVSVIVEFLISMYFMLILEESWSASMENVLSAVSTLDRSIPVI